METSLVLVGILGLGAVMLWGAIPLGLVLGISPWVTGVTAAMGAMLGVIAVAAVRHHSRRWLLRLRTVKGLATAHGLIYRVWDGYGAAGLGLVAPVLVGAPLGAAIGMALGIPTGRLLIWIGFGIVVWSAGLTFGFAMGLAEIGQ